MEINHGGRGKRLGAWARRHKFALILTPCLLIAVAGVIVGVLALTGRTTGDAATVDPETGEVTPLVKYFSHLTGKSVESKAAVSAPATCVMIENSPDARPQSGLSKAGVVYEAIAEGGITRFMAVFQPDILPELIGPVRSVRMYYAQWAKAYNCAIAHVGGASDALKMIRNSSNGYRDIDQFFNGDSYWRSRDRQAPHNVYTNAENMNKLNAAKGYDSSTFAGFDYAVGALTPTRAESKANNIQIALSSALWNVNYTYNAENNNYLRAHDSGGAHMDKNQSGELTQNAPTVVVAMEVSEVQRPGSGGHSNAVTTGTGTAYVFQNGEYIGATWRKDSENDELKFYDGAGEAVVFAPGQVWITAVPRGRTVNWQS